MTLADIILDAATAAVEPTPFALNSALRSAGIVDVRAYELHAGLHVRTRTAGVTEWRTLADLADAVLN